MRINLYAIKDNLNGYTPPMVFPNDEVAKREFKVFLDTNPSMKIKPDDFTLYFLGEYDTDTAITYNINDDGQHPKLIERG